MADVVFFAGPVIVGPDFGKIDWFGRDVRIIAIAGAGSSHFSNLAESVRGRNGSILDGIVARYARGISIDKIAFAAYSAGHGLLNKVGAEDQDRKRISAMILSDATFNAFDTPAKTGYVKFGLDAARGKRLMVSTTAHTTGGGHMTGRDSWRLVWNAVNDETWRWSRRVSPRSPAPPASGGWHKLGADLFWGDYTTPGAKANTGNDITHEGHHNVAPLIWQAYLAPYLAGRLGVPTWLWALLGASAGAGGLVAYERYRRTR